MSVSSLPLVTMVTPTYNAAEYLDEAIRSVLQQDYPHIEYIVLDDGSTDDTARVLEKYRGRFHFEAHANMGQAQTLNKGWAMGKGTIIGYLSADDVLLPWAVSRAVAMLLDNEDAVVAYPQYHMIDPAGKMLKKRQGKAFTYLDVAVYNRFGMGPGALMWKWTIDRIGGWRADLSFSPDREFYMRVGLLGRFCFIPEVCSLYRMHPQSISYARSDWQSSREHIVIVDSFFARDDLPGELRAYRATAMGQAHVTAAVVHLRAGRLAATAGSVREALRCDSTINPAKLMLILLRSWLSRHLRRLWWTLRRIVKV